MTAKILDGAAMALEVEKELKQRVDALREKNVVPGLCVILVGNDPASQTYVANKEKACARLGIHSQTLRMGAETTQAELEAAIERANEDEAIHGILVQLPLPAHLDEHRALALIRPEKDVDGFHAVNMGRLARGEDCVVACTPKGALHMLKAAGVPIAGKNAVVIGRSNIVGKPMALLLLQENATVTICHSRTENLAEYTRRADILVAAVGKPRFVTADMVKEGAAVLDVGINRVDGKLCGDVDFETVKEKAGWISPVPGGVGKMTIAMLMENTVSAAEKAAL
ncbi:MAG: bifunctional methylenetetrahydrofolate dehydrogenase/methenyltetrahydrofolate cyclohydrolase FolD [Candidatus Limiplasma sp.]|nr:bifunctional methylenetetrahydrofolate dehydrogenase/methenyltetrahydrofolate cyclohydrolase FolD [Candidatus Limiplasma sp.]